ncbi:MAG: hypothetical protein BGO59_31040 [Spirosoma sp. 48-14]|nr:MAG: hypothetical protein BGO59_31040 [Spirosoma sp. 48-14]
MKLLKKITDFGVISLSGTYVKYAKEYPFSLNINLWYISIAMVAWEIGAYIGEKLMDLISSF